MGLRKRSSSWIIYEAGVEEYINPESGISNKERNHE
jgi:hypothetical protein